LGHCCIQALSALNFSVDDQKHVFRILAGLLHLGNMSFDNSNPDAVGVSAASNETVQLCSKLFGVYVIQPNRCILLWVGFGLVGPYSRATWCLNRHQVRSASPVKIPFDDGCLFLLTMIFASHFLVGIHPGRH